jgi:RecA-family ATPase
VYEYHVRLDFLQYELDALQYVRRDVEQRLLVFHNGEVIIRYNTEHFQHLIEHLPVLTADADNGLDVRTCFQFIDQRTHFDGFRTCSEDNHDLFHLLPHF